MRHYRAILSVPIDAEDDSDAIDQATGFAQLVSHPSGALSAHVELLTEVGAQSLIPMRTVSEAAGFRGQIPITLL